MADEFDTDKGMKEDYDGTIREAYFQAADFGTSLILMINADDGVEVESRYSVGTDWASFDGGETVEHPSKQKIRADSQLATLVDRAMMAGAESVIRERSEGHGQKTAKLWPGLKFHWQTFGKPYSVKDRETGEEKSGTSFKSYPTAFLGVHEVAVSEAGEQSTGVSTGNEQVPDDIIVRLKVLAAAKPFPEWVDEALTIDYVRENMLAALSDEGFYNSLKG